MRLGLNDEVPPLAPARGFTLVEILVALAITLIMMGAVVTLFGVISQSVAESRSAIEMSDRLRAARNQLQLDLGGATATMQPPLRPENDEGYLEIIEGPENDSSPRAADPAHWSLFGDVDDVLMLTVRNRVAPFIGKYEVGGVDQSIESPLAEVIYFLVQDGPIIDATTTPPTKLCTLYRRMLLVSPNIGSITVFTEEFYDDHDLSVHYVDPGSMPTLVPNTLGDLTKRENRFAHYGTGTYGLFPFQVNTSGLPRIQTTPTVEWVAFTPPVPPGSWPPRPDHSAFLAPFDVDRPGDDVLLTNVLAFDVQVWDPGAPIFVAKDSANKPIMAVEPCDPGYRGQNTLKAWAADGTGYLPTSTSRPSAFGAYVDLGYLWFLQDPSDLNYFNPGDPIPILRSYNPPAPVPLFDRINANARSGFTSTFTTPRVYDTWSMHYENDGVDQFVDMDIDEGTNGLDDNGDGIVDDNGASSLTNRFDDDSDMMIDEPDEYDGEYDTLPPYSAPLRGIRVTIRVYEPSSQQVREAVVIQDFLPE